MAARKIIVKVNLETGATEIEAIGYNGSGCKDATRDFENALGVVEDRTVKPVMWNNTMQDSQHIQQKGS